MWRVLFYWVTSELEFAQVFINLRFSQFGADRLNIFIIPDNFLSFYMKLIFAFFLIGLFQGLYIRGGIIFLVFIFRIRATQLGWMALIKLILILFHCSGGFFIVRVRAAQPGWIVLIKVVLILFHLFHQVIKLPFAFTRNASHLI